MFWNNNVINLESYDGLFFFCCFFFNARVIGLTFKENSGFYVCTFISLISNSQMSRIRTATHLSFVYLSALRFSYWIMSERTGWTLTLKKVSQLHGIPIWCALGIHPKNRKINIKFVLFSQICFHLRSVEFLNKNDRH